MTFDAMLKNEASRLNANVILDVIFKYIDKAYMSDMFAFYDSMEIALAIYHEHIKKAYATEDIIRAFRYYNENGSTTYSGISKVVFESIAFLANEDYNLKLQKEIERIPTFGNCDQ